MSDYTKTTNFTAKDSLSTGDADKLIKGSLFDTEFDAIATAIATKYDTNDIADEATAEALASNAVLLTPLRLDNVFKDNAGMLSDIQALTAPLTDTLLGWDVSASAAIGFTAGAGIVFSGTTLTADHDAATNFVADEHVAHSGVEIQAGNGLTGGGTIAATRSLAVGAGDGISVAADSVAVDSTVARNNADETFSENVTIQKAFATSGVITPSVLSASQNNYAPTGHADAVLIRLDANGNTPADITGLAGGVDGRRVILHRIPGTTGTIRLMHENASSTAANRFSTNVSGLTIDSVKTSASLIYDGTANRWLTITPAQ